MITTTSSESDYAVFYEAPAWVQAEINPDVAVAAGLWQPEELMQQEARQSSVQRRSVL